LSIGASNSITTFSANSGGTVYAGNITATGNITTTGNMIAATANISANNTQVATTAFVHNMLPAGVILMWSGSSATIPYGWYLCDGTNSTPDLRNKFIVGATSTYAVGATGGSADAVVVSHSHSINDPTHRHYVGSRDSTADNGGNATQEFVQNAGTGAGPNTYTDYEATGITINSAGSSATNANLPPYNALCYIMKS